MVSSRVGDPGKRRLSFPIALGLTVLACTLLVCSFYPVNAGFLAWFALTPWLLMLAFCGMRRSLYLTFGFGFFLFFFGTHWIKIVGGTYAGLIAVAAIMALLVMLAGTLIKLLRWGTPFPLAFIVPVVWVPLEFIRSILFTGFPWLFLAHTQHGYLPVIQISDLVGAYGVSTLLAITSGCLADLTIRYLTKPRGRSLFDRKTAVTAGATLTLVLATGIYGVVRLSTLEINDGPKLLLVQSNYPMYEKKKGQNRVSNFKRLRALSIAGLGEEADNDIDIVVWSETTVPMRFINDPDLEYHRKLEEALERKRKGASAWDPNLAAQLRKLRDGEIVFNQSVSQWMTQFSKQKEIHLLVGASTGKQLYGLPGDPKKMAFLPFDALDRSLIPNTITDADLVQYNSVYFYGPGGRFLERYDKRHLVPVGEYVPLSGLPAVKKSLAEYIYSMAGFLSDVEPGREVKICRLPGKDGKSYFFANIICFENAFPALSREGAYPTDKNSVKERKKAGFETKKTAQFIVNPSNDGWFLDSAQLDQEVAISVFRAVENRVGFVRCANTGISLFIDPDGSIAPDAILTDASGNKKEVEGFLARRVKICPELTIYSRYGDFLVIGLILLFLTSLAISLRPKEFTDGGCNRENE